MQFPARSFPLTLSLLVVAPGLAQATPSSDFALNEVSVRHTGLERREFVEITGPAGQPLDGLMILGIDGDAGSLGQLSIVLDLRGLTMPNDGYFYAGGIDFAGDQDLSMPVDLWENGTWTVVLLETDDPDAVVALRGTNVDPDGDGITTLGGLGVLVDLVGLADRGLNDGTDRIFDGAQALQAQGGKLPPGVFRSGDAPGAWCPRVLDFNLVENVDIARTPGGPNPECPFDEIKLVPAVTRDHMLFGYSMDADGGRVAVGAIGDDSTGTGGAAYLFGPLGEELGRFVPAAAIDLDHEQLGFSVALSGNALLVGAPDDDATGFFGGSAHLFDTSTGAEGPTLLASDGDIGLYFGTSVAVDGSMALVGAPGARSSEGVRTGAAYLFDTFSGTQLAKLEDPLAKVDDNSGSTVAISEEYIAVGAPYGSTNGRDSGTVAIFDRITHALLGRISGLEAGDQIGQAIAIEGGRLYCGTEGFGDGGAYVFDLATMQLEQVLTVPLGTGRKYGRALAVQGGRVLLGTPAAADRAFLFEPEATSPQAVVVETIVSDDDEAAWSVALDENFAYLGWTTDRHLGKISGSVIAFELSTGQRYCDVLPNSTGFPARMEAIGSANLGAEDLTLRASPVPVLTPGLFFYGEAATQVPFGDGFRCVGGLSGRLPIEVATSDGVLTHAIQFDSPPTAALQINAGSTWFFQAWFRDPVAGGAGFQLSDGLEVTFRL